MTKLTARSHFYVNGINISGDVGSISAARGGPAMLDVSGLNQPGFERLAGRFDGNIDFNTWFNPDRAHAVFANVPATDADVMVPIHPATGAWTAFMRARQVNYDMALQNDLGAGFTVQALSARGFPLEWGKLLTNDMRTDTSATASGTGFDLGIPKGVAPVNITSTSVDDPTLITTDAPHGLIDGDSILIAGDNSTPSLNGGHTVTVVSDTTFTIPIEVTNAGSAGTVQRTSHRGWAAMLQLFAFSGTSVTVKLQDAANNQAGQMTDVANAAFSAHSSAPASERISDPGPIRRYVRVATTGTFNPATYAVAIRPFRG